MRLPAMKYHPSIARVREGSRVGDRRQGGRPIGTVDTLGSGGGSRWAIVSWPAVDTPTARAPNGRRGQVFDLSALIVLDPPDQADPTPPDPTTTEE
jgi:hypothetical protein